jgi:hypothetical protein
LSGSQYSFELEITGRYLRLGVTLQYYVICKCLVREGHVRIHHRFLLEKFNVQLQRGVASKLKYSTFYILR